MATLITVTILRIPDLELGHVADLLDWIFLLFPSYAMASGITDLYNNWRIIGICRKEIFDFLCEIKSFANPCCKRELDFFYTSLRLFLIFKIFLFVYTFTPFSL